MSLAQTRKKWSTVAYAQSKPRTNSPPQAPVSSNPEIEGDTSKMAPLEIEGPDIEADIEALTKMPQ
jgi:hypothetical protein